MVFTELFNFSNWDTTQWVAQIIGLIAVVLFVASYQQKRAHLIILVQLLGCVFWIINMSLLGLISGILLNTISMTRCFVFFFRDKHKWARHWIWYPIFIILFFSAGFYSYFKGDGWLGFLPAIALIITTIALTFKNPLHIRISVFVSCPLWLVYNALLNNPAGVLNEVVCMGVTLIGIITIDLLKRKKKPEA